MGVLGTGNAQARHQHLPQGWPGHKRLISASNDIVASSRESEKDKGLQCCWGRLSESRRWMSELEYQIAPFP